MTYTTEDLLKMLKRVEDMSLYKASDKKSLEWFFDCGVRTVIGSLDAQIRLDEMRNERRSAS